MLFRSRWMFYSYNVMASALSVLFSEPTGGVFALTRGVLTGDVSVSDCVSPIASLSIACVIAVFLWKRRRTIRAWQLDADDRLVLLFLIVLAANAVVSFPYLKDVVMSPAGAFLAVAGFVAVRDILSSLPRATTTARAAALAALCAVVGVTWAIRATGTYLDLRRAASVERNEWAYADPTLAADGEIGRAHV